MNQVRQFNIRIFFAYVFIMLIAMIVVLVPTYTILKTKPPCNYAVTVYNIVSVSRAGQDIKFLDTEGRIHKLSRISALRVGAEVCIE